MTSISNTTATYLHPLDRPEILEDIERCKSNLFYQKVAFVVCSIALGLFAAGMCIGSVYFIGLAIPLVAASSTSQYIIAALIGPLLGIVSAELAFTIKGYKDSYMNYWKEKALTELATIGIEESCIFQACTSDFPEQVLASSLELLEYSGYQKEYIEYTENGFSIANQAIYRQDSSLISLLQDHGIDFFDDSKLNNIPILQDAMWFGDPNIINFVLNLYEEQQQNPLPQLSLASTINPLECRFTHENLDQVTENFNYLKSNHRDLFDTLKTMPNIYGYTPVDIALKFRHDFILPTLMDLSIDEIHRLPNYGLIPLFRQNQTRLINRFEEYIQVQSSIEGTERENYFDKGLCCGLCFYESYLNTKSRDRWQNYLLVINSWDGTPEGLRDTVFTSQFINGRFRDVGDFFESILNDIIWFQHLDNRMINLSRSPFFSWNPFAQTTGNEFGAAFPFSQTERPNQLSFVSPENDTIFLQNFVLSNIRQTYNFTEFKVKMEELCQLPVGTYIEISSKVHQTKVEILPNNQFRYFEPNARDIIPPFSDLNSLLELIWKTQFEIDPLDTSKANFYYKHYQFETTSS